MRDSFLAVSLMIGICLEFAVLTNTPPRGSRGEAARRAAPGDAHRAEHELPREADSAGRAAVAARTDAACLAPIWIAVVSVGRADLRTTASLDDLVHHLLVNRSRGPASNTIRKLSPVLVD
jgi:hypothetical protein